VPTDAPTQTSPPTPTSSPSASEPPTAVPTPGRCVGACAGENRVALADLVKAVNIALATLPLSACEAADANGDRRVTVDELVVAVNNALNGCP
jgi:hypothetical protein